MKIELNSNRLDYLPTHPWFRDSNSFSIYKPKIHSAGADRILFNWKSLSLHSELVSSIIENVFENPFIEWDCMEFVAKLLHYKNTKLHHWWIMRQKLLTLEWDNLYLWNHGESRNTPERWNHILLNLGGELTQQNYSPITVWKLGDKHKVVFADTSELDKIYGHKKLTWYFDDSKNFESYITKNMKNKAVWL
jgi:hypothetical protein